MKTSYKVAAAEAEASNDFNRHARGTISENGEVTLRVDRKSAEMILSDIRSTHGVDCEKNPTTLGPVRWVLIKLLEGAK